MAHNPGNEYQIRIVHKRYLRISVASGSLWEFQRGAHADPRVGLSSKLGAQTSFPATQSMERSTLAVRKR